MALVDRARAMIAQPAQEWPNVAAEPDTTQSILSGYVLPLALIGPVFGLVGTLAFAHLPILYAIASSVLEFVLEIVAVFVVAFIADLLAPSFGGSKDSLASFKWVAYSSTARWVAGVFEIIPGTGRLILLLASLYSLYTLYLGTVPVMRIPPEKAVGFTVVVIVAYIVAIGIVTVLLGIILGLIFAGAAVATGGLRQ